jgi:hypothetical protein
MFGFFRRLALTALAIGFVHSGAAAAVGPGPAPQPVQIVVGESIATYGANINLRATLTSGGSPLANAAIKFTLDGTNLGPIQASTDASGVGRASVPVPDQIAVGHYASHVTYAGDAGHKPASATGDFSIIKAATIIGGSFSTASEPGYPAGSPLRWYEVIDASLLRRTDNHGLPGRTIDISLDGAPLTTVQTDPQGKFGIKVAVKKPTGAYTMQLDFGGDDRYTASSVQEPVLIAGPKTTIYYTKPKVYVPSGKFLTGEDVYYSVKFTTQPNGGGSPVAGVKALICSPKLEQQGSVSQYGGCDDTVSNGGGVATKHTTLQVPGTNKVSVDLNEDIRYNDGSNLTTTFSVTAAATKIVAKLPLTVVSPGELAFDASAVFAANGKPLPCFGISLFLQPPGYGWQGPAAQGFGCGVKTVHLSTHFYDGWDPGLWKVKLSLDNTAGFVHSEATYTITVVRQKVNLPVH